MINIYDAILKNNVKSIKRIINQDPLVVHYKNSSDVTPLHFACNHGNVDIAELLIDAGADIHVKDQIGRTPLHVSCYYNQAEIVHLLIDMGADVNARMNVIGTPLHVACFTSRTTILPLLIRAGANWLSVDDHNQTPVDYAVEEQSNAMLVFLETIIDQLPNSEQKKIRAWRFRRELIKTS